MYAIFEGERCVVWIRVAELGAWTDDRTESVGGKCEQTTPSTEPTDQQTAPPSVNNLHSTETSGAQTWSTSGKHIHLLNSHIHLLNKHIHLLYNWILPKFKLTV